MYLKSLTLRGFKSFASATTLRFEPGITCIVGPNGSGKSNVVDALAWVMGAQGAKSLRGGKMEDVIFAGSGGQGGRPPLGRAEVALTIDNSDGALPIDYSEVSISRTMFRNGGSEYAINGQACRLLDVQELLSDSGIGREMHVVVGQGQLDSILHATPEERRGFIEEAAGVLKHRKRKEKALRKLEACDGNLTRLGDLLTELRRQLKPLGRQAEVARKAAVVQADLRDARARLLADELVTLQAAMEQEQADEDSLLQRRAETEEQISAAREQESDLERQLRDGLPELAGAQQTWFALDGLRERFAATATLARERVRRAANEPDVLRAGDPEGLIAQARTLEIDQHQIEAEVVSNRASLEQATEARRSAEQAHADEVRRVGAAERAAADRREGRATLLGKVDAMRSRARAAEEEIGRLTAARLAALERAERAQHDFTALETRVAGLAAGEEGLDAEHEGAASTLQDVEDRLGKLKEETHAADRSRSALTARRDALELGLNRKDGSAALLAATVPVSGLLGSVAALLSVRSGYEVAVAVALGAAADAVAAEEVGSAVEAVQRLRRDDLGRASIVLGGAPSAGRQWPPLPGAACYAVDVVDCPEVLRPALRRLLDRVAVVDAIEDARDLVASIPDIVAVTRGGDLVSRHFVSGGSASVPSLLEVQAAVDETNDELAQVAHACERLTFDLTRLEQERAEARRRVDVSLAKLHESDAQLAAVAEELAQHGSLARSAREEAARLTQAIEAAQESRDQDLAGLADLEARLDTVESADTEDDLPDRREDLTETTRTARAAETEARLTLRTSEERVRALKDRVASLRRAAEEQREAQARAVAHRERVRREGRVGEAVSAACGVAHEHLQRSLASASTLRESVEARRRTCEAELVAVRARLRDLDTELARLVDSAHRDELARTHQTMRLEHLQERALEELGLDGEALVSGYGPDLPVPVLVADADGVPQSGDPVPFVREEQQKRLRAAERALALLGKVNPLALEEFSALEERHQFLGEQLEDLRRTRRDLLDIVKEVDERVEQVFTQAWQDVSAAFEQTFARIFPGGEGRLLLTDPDNMLVTGIDVEARPPGKKVKRLSLLSGGERSLVAVTFLVALFKARPSPFYILDEVEAALDDTNLGRLLEIYEELRDTSQLLVVTHQKRTMEVGDALYGVSMRGDGVSAVISQRLREAESA